mmetsp:Transcript_21555/g.26678  ORF Transcript_21555/g.26678 Transcript_21555/m.26678 type:complete len:196 (+) Transcript_21555:207-794(+)
MTKFFKVSQLLTTILLVLLLSSIVTEVKSDGENAGASSPDEGLPSLNEDTPPPIEEDVVLGGYGGVNLDDDDVVSAAKYAFEKYKQRNDRKFSFAILKNLTFRVDDCERQVVAGTNYKMSISVMGENRCVAAFEAHLFRDLEMNYSEPSLKTIPCKDTDMAEPLQLQGSISHGNKLSASRLLWLVLLAGSFLIDL